MQISSKLIEQSISTYEAVFEIDKKGDSKEINEPLLKDELSALTRAKAEFLENGFDKQSVEFSTYFLELHVGDVIEVFAPIYNVPSDLTKSRFIVENVKHSFKDGEILSTVRGVRYD